MSTIFSIDEIEMLPNISGHAQCGQGIFVEQPAEASSSDHSVQMKAENEKARKKLDEYRFKLQQTQSKSSSETTTAQLRSHLKEFHAIK